MQKKGNRLSNPLINNFRSLVLGAFFIKFSN
jgi:hypothetical protein